jgi:hypothetical protein
LATTQVAARTTGVDRNVSWYFLDIVASYSFDLTCRALHTIHLVSVGKYRKKLKKNDTSGRRSDWQKRSDTNVPFPIVFSSSEVEAHFSH